MVKDNLLSGIEFEIMRILWDANKPLSINDICEQFNLNNKSKRTKRTIFLSINKLMEKGLVQIDGFVRHNKSYPRTFSTSISAAKYMAEKVYYTLSQKEIKEFKKELVELCKRGENAEET